jgi:hypothetical protein
MIRGPFSLLTWVLPLASPPAMPASLRHFGVSAKDYEDIIAQLGANNVIGASLRDRLKGLGGFRCGIPHPGAAGLLRFRPRRAQMADDDRVNR